MTPLLNFDCRLLYADLCDKMAWNLSGLTIILLFLNQSITISDPDCKMSINSKIVSAKADNELPSEKL